MKIANAKQIKLAHGSRAWAGRFEALKRQFPDDVVASETRPIKRGEHAIFVLISPAREITQAMMDEIVGKFSPRKRPVPIEIRRIVGPR